jgi:hypothetical protein
MKPRALWKSIGVAVVVLFASRLPLAAQAPFTPLTFKCAGGCVRLANNFVRADVAPNGTWVLGTTGGDPDTQADDDKNLLYGFFPGGASSVGTGFTSLRVLGDGSIPVFEEALQRIAPQRLENGRIETSWAWDRPYAMRITQTLGLRQNPFSGRMDMVEFAYQLHNLGPTPLQMGLRALLDIKIGGTDGAPYFVPGVGAVIHERSFEGAAVPPYWLAFESPIYDQRELRSVGLLKDEALDRPDRFVIARWRQLQGEIWNVAIDSTKVVTGDSAVALYWDPVEVAPGQMITRRSAYGLSGNRGGEAFLSAKVEARCGEEIDVAIFVNNFDTVSLNNGEARLVLPAGWSFVGGGSDRLPLATIAPGQTGSAVWRVRVGGASGRYSLQGVANFSGGRSFNASSDVEVECLPSPTPPASPTPLPASPTRPPSPTPADDEAFVCNQIVRRVPPAAISAALANPAAVYGWMDPANPALPPGPNNPLKRWLSLSNLNKAYHPIFNALVFKVGCP